MLTFDKAMYDNATHTGNAVTNPANYQLLLNGVKVAGGISQVYYGLDEANALGSQYGLNVPQAEPVRGRADRRRQRRRPGVQPLGNGQYQIVALNTLRDVAGNPLKAAG